MIKIVENCTFIAKYECLNDFEENVLLQKRLYPLETINQGTNVVQILIEEGVENGEFYHKSLVYEIGSYFSHVLERDGKYTYFSIRLWTLDGWNDDLMRNEDKYPFEENSYVKRTPIDMFYLDKKKDEETKEEKWAIYKNGEEVPIEDLATAVITATENWGCLELQKEDVFSLCNFENCMIKLQKETLINGLLSSGNKRCIDKSSLVEQREFMFITYNLLKSLIHQERYEQAQQLLDDVTSKCGGICKTQSIKNDCGCKN